MTKKMKSAVTPIQASNFYRDLKAYKPSAPSKVDNPVGHECANLLLKVSQKCTESEFVDFVIGNEIPPLKLTNSEMNLLSGGRNFFQYCWDCMQGKTGVTMVWPYGGQA